MSVVYMKIKNHLHINGIALYLSLKQRLGVLGNGLNSLLA